MRVDVLGTRYTIFERSEQEDKRLEDLDGYTNRFKHQIVVAKKRDDWEEEEYTLLRKEVLRHEIEHAFLYESGLGASWEHKPHGHDETYVDWYAMQFPKLLKAFESVGAI